MSNTHPGRGCDLITLPSDQPAWVRLPHSCSKWITVLLNRSQFACWHGWSNYTNKQTSRSRPWTFPVERQLQVKWPGGFSGSWLEKNECLRSFRGFFASRKRKKRASYWPFAYFCCTAELSSHLIPVWWNKISISREECYTLETTNISHRQLTQILGTCVLKCNRKLTTLCGLNGWRAVGQSFTCCICCNGHKCTMWTECHQLPPPPSESHWPVEALLKLRHFVSFGLT